MLLSLVIFVFKKHVITINYQIRNIIFIISFLAINLVTNFHSYELL